MSAGRCEQLTAGGNNERDERDWRDERDDDDCGIRCPIARLARPPI